MSIIEIHTKRYPKRWVYFSGSTKERTRLYRMAIGLNIEILLAKFEIYAENMDGKWTPFIKNLEINAFLIKTKIP